LRSSIFIGSSKAAAVRQAHEGQSSKPMMEASRRHRSGDLQVKSRANTRQLPLLART
jgi:hypothetical protein